jgi:nitroreductase
MELSQLIESRHSVRAYRNQPVEPAKLQAVLATASRGPTGGGLQAFRICVVRRQELRQAVADSAHGQVFVASAPLVLVVCADTTRAGHLGHTREENYSVQDAMIAATYAQLGAVDQGLATCWVGGFDGQRLARALNLPAELRPCVVLPLGYAAETAEPVARRPLSELVMEVS